MVARYNPCGHVVDIGHDPYTVTARLYPDSDRVFTIKWYEAHKDAKVLPFPSALTNLVFERDREDWLPTAVGEIFGGPWQQNAREDAPLATGDHFCGTEKDFAGEGEIDEDAPPVEYRPDGLPLCCGQQFEMRGGLGLGDIQSVDTQPLVLAQVVSSTGTPPLHVCVRMTRDVDNNVVLFSPETTYTQVLNPESWEYPAATLIQIYEIEDWPGYFWGELFTQYAPTDTVNISRDESTGTVTADATTQLSITSDASGIKLVGDGTPAANRYYGTPASGTTRGYQDLGAAVAAAITDQTTINELLAALFLNAPNFGIAIIAGGGGVFFAGIDLAVNSTTDETLVNSATVAVNNAAVLTVSQTQTTYVNSFNAAGMIIDRVPGGPVTNTSSVNYDGSDTILVTSSAATSTMTFSAIYQMSLTADADGLRLVGDLDDPGAAYVYSTNGAGDKGWYPLDGTWLDMVAGVLSHIGPASTGHTTVNGPSQIVYDAKGHVVSVTGGGGSGVTSISTTNLTGGPLTGAITINGSAPIQVGVASNTISIGLGVQGVGPQPTTAPSLSATAGNAQVSLTWTAATGATSYVLSRGGVVIDVTSGFTFLDTGLTNGVTYSYSVSGENNYALGPAGTASATPAAPVASAASGSGTTGPIAVPLPANVPGDLLAVGLAIDNHAGAPTAPAGWVLRGQLAGTFNTIAVYTRNSSGSLSTLNLLSAGQLNWRSVTYNYGPKSYITLQLAQSNGTIASSIAIAISGTGNAVSDWYIADHITTSITNTNGLPQNNAWLTADAQGVVGSTTGTHQATLSVSDTWSVFSIVVQ